MKLYIQIVDYTQTADGLQSSEWDIVQVVAKCNIFPYKKQTNNKKFNVHPYCPQLPVNCHTQIVYPAHTKYVAVIDVWSRMGERDRDVMVWNDGIETIKNTGLKTLFNIVEVWF